MNSLDSLMTDFQTILKHLQDNGWKIKNQSISQQLRNLDKKFDKEPFLMIAANFKKTIDSCCQDLSINPASIPSPLSGFDQQKGFSDSKVMNQEARLNSQELLQSKLISKIKDP